MDAIAARPLKLSATGAVYHYWRCHRAKKAIIVKQQQMLFHDDVRFIIFLLRVCKSQPDCVIFQQSLEAKQRNARSLTKYQEAAIEASKYFRKIIHQTTNYYYEPQSSQEGEEEEEEVAILNELESKSDVYVVPAQDVSSVQFKFGISISFKMQSDCILNGLWARNCVASSSCVK